MAINDQPIQTFLDALASQASTPGGGSAAAIMGAMGAALVSMVCHLTIGKKTYADVEAELRGVLVRAEHLRARLTDMIDDDIRAFDAVMAAYGLPRDTEAQKARRAEAIQAALREATEVPLACARACAEVIELSAVAADKGNRNAIGDAGAAVLAAHAGLRTMALNVYSNAASIRDRPFADASLAELETLLARGTRRTEEVFALVRNKLG